LKTNEPILIQTGASVARVKGTKRSTLWVRRSKFKVARGRNTSQKSLSARYLEQGCQSTSGMTFSNFLTMSENTP